MQTVTTTLKYSTPLLLWPGREFTRVKLLQSKHSPRNLVKAYLQWLIFRNTITLDIFNKPIYKYSGEGGGTPLQCSCLENPMDGGAWWAAVPGVSKSRTRLSDSTFTFMHWRRKWQPTPVFLPGEPQGRGRLVGCHLWGCTESDTTEVT